MCQLRFRLLTRAFHLFFCWAILQVRSNWAAYYLLVGDFGCVGICTFRRMASIPYCMAGL
jgi:hypothetical protein